MRSAAFAAAAASWAVASAAPSAFPALVTLAETQARATLAQLADAVTAYPTNGALNNPSVGWLTGSAGGWTSGFWPAHLLNLGIVTGDASFTEQGTAWAQGIASQQYNTGTHGAACGGRG